jgi:2-polyprenyl-6-methoxyphenol hydroxylase-like FAD-dependent oxidoreductase
MLLRKVEKILVVGAGIAGCCAAIALAARGFTVRLIEKQDVWRFQSSGIFVYSNGLSSLRDIGVLDDVVAAGYLIEDGRNVYFDHHGNHLVDTFYPTADEGQVPAILGIKRAELHRILANQLAHFGLSAELGTTVRRLEQTGDSVEIELSNGSIENFDLVIAADGLRSQIRQLAGFDIRPKYSGLGVWRSVHDRPEDLRDKIMMMGPGKRFGIMPISADKLYTFGTIVEPEGKWYDPAAWSETMAAKFREFEGPARRFLEELGSRSEILYTAVEEIVIPLPWHSGRVMLIGDAAHASTPFMGQGGAMGVQDAVILAQLLDSDSEVDAILRTYGEARQPVCRFAQDVSRQVGENGAASTSQSAADNDRFRKTAQQNVDIFYDKLSELNRSAHSIVADTVGMSAS